MQRAMWFPGSGSSQEPPLSVHLPIIFAPLKFWFMLLARLTATRLWRSAPLSCENSKQRSPTGSAPPGSRTLRRERISIRPYFLSQLPRRRSRAGSRRCVVCADSSFLAQSLIGPHCSFFELCYYQAPLARLRRVFGGEMFNHHRNNAAHMG